MAPGEEAPEDLVLPDSSPSGEVTSRLGDDIAAAVRAQADQGKAGMEELARMLRTYHDSLVAAGFSASEALVLTLNYQATMIAAALQRQGRSET